MKEYTDALARIKWAIKNSNKTQVELAKHLGRTPTYISQILSDKSKMSLEEFFKIAAWLDIEPHNLVN